ncbi:SnoaL-like domain-containing protein [Parasediminibacterium sp. JCM 36343]|uniref:SnoaL-like domain-containing protein n=1 Tax=Parasediminibacterium sp. JCM 36343 TaxID=3374279 RepID=UPI00397C5171
MSEQQIVMSLDELVSLVGEGKPMEAFEKFYHDDLEKTDLDGITHKGKAVNEKIGYELLSKVTAIRDFTAVGKIVKGNRSFLVWSLDFDHADNGAIKVVQIAIQDWEEGKIIRERFIA